MKVLTIANNKGGVGKTALACQFGHYVADRGLRTVLLEFDGQMNASASLARGGSAMRAPFSMMDVFEGRADSLPKDSFVVVPAVEIMEKLQAAGGDKFNDFVNHLRDWMIAQDEAFDICVIDNAPSKDIRWGASMATADALVIPLQLRQEAVEGVASFFDHPDFGYRRMKHGRAARTGCVAAKPVNPDLKLIGLLPNLVQRMAREKRAHDWLQENYPTLLMTLPGGADALIKHRVALYEAQERGVFVGNLRTKEAREVWDEVKPIFGEILRQLEVPVPAVAAAPITENTP